jgi:RHS repeat-associated protein
MTQPDASTTQLGACSFSVAFQNDYKFTGKERDSESGNDYFGARYYGSSLGRFMTPDWSAKPQTVPYADLGNPQSLNLYSYVVNNPLNRTDPLGHDWFYVDKKWQWQKGHTYHDANGNATKDKGYAGLLVAQANGTNKQGATTYKLTLYDQNKVVATGTGFSGNNNYSNTGAIKDGNYQILGRFDPPPTAPNPSSPDNNPPPVYGYQKIDPSINPYANAVYQAYGPMRARLNPLDPSGSQGAYFHGQFGDAFHSEGWTHGCLSYGRDTTMIDYMSSHFGNTWTGVSVDTQVEKPQ